jgi:lipopolysaccharide transport system ATP-binding protein
MSHDIAISVRGLSKSYTINHDEEKHATLASTVAQRIKNPFKQSRKETFWALQDVSFEVKKGDIVGVIGRNGAGKSTLFKVLSRITEPTKGEVDVYGRIGSLLEVGTGFSGELTGRENIYLNGTILGMKRWEIDKRFEEIVDFSGVEKFLETPVKRYSSGMYVRLAFAVAAHLDPEILIVDEVLSVGDAAFQEKCAGRIRQVADGGRTVLFVSHNTTAIRQLTDKCLYLEKGHLIAQGKTHEILDKYEKSDQDTLTTIYEIDGSTRRIRCGREIEFVRLELRSTSGTVLKLTDTVRIRATVRGNHDIPSFRFGITIFQKGGNPVGNTFTAQNFAISAGETAGFDLELAALSLAPGSYHCGLSVGRGTHKTGIQDFDIVLEVLHFEISMVDETVFALGTWDPAWGPICFPPPLAARSHSAEPIKRVC